MAGALLDELEQAVHAAGVLGVVSHVAQGQHALLGVDGIDGVPGRQVDVVAGGHGGATLHGAAVAQQRHHAFQAQLAVEVGTADMHAARGEDVAGAVGQVAALRRQAHQGEVRGTAADVDDQHQLFTLDAALVVEGGGKGFELEGDVAEAYLARHGGQGVLGLLVSDRVVIDEMHRTAQHHGVEGAIGLLFGALFEGAEEQAEHLGEGQGGAEDAGLALEQVGAE